MKRWHVSTRTMRENPRVDAFLREIVEVSKRHGLTVNYEDDAGEYVVRDREPNETDRSLLAAWDCTDGRPAPAPVTSGVYSDIVSDGGMDPRNRPGGYEDQRRNCTCDGVGICAWCQRRGT